jgi:PQQ-dependent catabolism-associated CXXCW motif protein
MKFRTMSLAAALLLSGAATAQDSFGGGAPARPAAPPARAPSAAAAPDPAREQNSPERADLGIAATNQLHTGAMHGATPNSIPGGQVITTRGLQDLIANRQTPFLLLDILGGPQMIPGAQFAVPAAQPGSFSDATQQQFGQFLQEATRGNKEVPLVLYCQSRECWMSYNAALRAINLGYRNVLWYRGGIEAWQAAGQPVQAPGGQAPQR